MAREQELGRDSRESFEERDAAPWSRRPRVSVVIPNWNGAHWLERCLAALHRQRYRDYEILVVDNGSTDASHSVTQQTSPRARWIGLERNTGFSGAVNQGILAARGEYVALLNNDTEAEPGWLDALVDALDRRPDTAVAASRMLDDAERDRVYCAGGGLTRQAVPIVIGAGQLDDGSYDEEREVFWACAGAALYRRSLFDEIGLFEESFFAYFEDLDLCFRAQLAGQRCLYVPAAVVYHVGNGTSGRDSALTVRLVARNRLLMVARNFPWSHIAAMLPALVGEERRRLEWAKNEGRLGVVLAAYASFLFRLPRALAARRRIQARRRVSPADLERALEESEISLLCRDRVWSPQSE